MAVFLIVPTSKGAIARKLGSMFPGAFYALPQGEFLVHYDGTSKALSDALGISNGEAGAAVVASLVGYYGRASNDVWDWMNQHWGPE